MVHQYQLPQMIESRLDQDSINTLLNEFMYVLNEQHNARHAELDWSWTDGTKTYGWAKQHIKNMHDTSKYSWLKMISNNMDFVFSVYGIPVQFTKDCIANPGKKHRLQMNKPEFEQYRLFSKTEPELDIKWRVIVEKDIDSDEMSPSWTIALVGFNYFNAIVAMQSIEGFVSSIPVHMVGDDQPVEKEIEAVPVYRRRSDEQIKNESI